jgi:hypothetical protein
MPRQSLSTQPKSDHHTLPGAFPDINADHGGRCAELLRHGVPCLGHPLASLTCWQAGARPDHSISGSRDRIPIHRGAAITVTVEVRYVRLDAGNN